MNFINKTVTGCILAGAIFASVVSCTSCKRDDVTPKTIPTVVVVPSVVVPPIPLVQTIESSKMSIVLPITFEDQRAETADDSDYRLFANMAAKELVSLDSSKFNESYEEFVLEGIRLIRSREITVQSSEKTNINSQDFVVTEASKDGVVAWYWMTTKDGVGYTFTCGGEESAVKTLHTNCFGFASTIVIK